MGADDDLEDWDDGIELKKAVPKKTTNNWDLDEKQRKNEQDNDTLGFLKQADAEKKAIANRIE
jgi:hypothetical protein